MTNIFSLPDEIILSILKYCDPENCFEFTSLCKILHKLRNKSMCYILNLMLEKELCTKNWKIKDFFPEKRQYAHRLTGSTMVKIITNSTYTSGDIDIFYDGEMPVLPLLENRDIENSGSYIPVNIYEQNSGHFLLNKVLIPGKEKIDFVRDNSIIDNDYVKVHARFDINICKSYFDGLNYVIIDPLNSFKKKTIYNRIDKHINMSRIKKYQERGFTIIY